MVAHLIEWPPVVPERYQLIYLSRLATEASPSCVAEIVRSARQRNQALGIGSVLVFNGGHFCQYLEGEAAAVLDLAGRIRADRRHADFTLLHQGVPSGPPLVGGCSLVYALCYDDSLDRLGQARGPQAVALLADLLPTLDREP